MPDEEAAADLPLRAPARPSAPRRMLGILARRAAARMQRQPPLPPGAPAPATVTVQPPPAVLDDEGPLTLDGLYHLSRSL